jgi:hypothetical protein
LQVALWISDASDETSRESIGKTFQEKLHPVDLNHNLHGGTGTPAQFTFEMHAESFKRYATGTQQQQQQQQKGGRTHSSRHGGGGEERKASCTTRMAR